MSSFRMFNHRSEVSGRIQPIGYEAGNIEIRFVKKTTKQKKEKKTEPVCLSAWRVDWLTSIHASCLTTVVSQNERMYVHVFVWVCACERVQIYVSACFCVCVRHDTRLRCKNDQMSLLLLFLFFLNLNSFVCICDHSDPLYFIIYY